jgi:hypothetical protein
MAITYPRLIPGGCMATDTMRLVRTETAAQLVSGVVQVTQLGMPRWKCDYTTKPMRGMAERKKWRAWLDSLEGAMQTFLGHSPMQIWPTAYPRGFAGINRASGGPFPGQGEVTAITTTTITMNGLPASFVVGAGDLLGLIDDTHYGMHRIMEDVIGNLDGTMTVTVKPFVNLSLFGVGAVVNFAKPKCEMILDPATPPDTSADITFKPVTFTGVQRWY